MKTENLHQAHLIIKRLNEAGFKAYLTGGAVRDAVAGKNSEDFDICTSATIEEIKNSFHKTVTVGRKNQTVIVLTEENKYEVTPFNGTTLDDDLKNRDFTINAIVYHPEEGVKDPLGGREDLLKHKVLKTPKLASVTLREDPLRMLRAVRFSHSFQLRLDENIIDFSNDHAYLLNEVPIERIRSEWLKCASLFFTEESFKTFFSSKLIQLFPYFNKDLHKLSGLPYIKLRDQKDKDSLWWFFTLYADDLNRFTQAIQAFSFSKNRCNFYRSVWTVAEEAVSSGLSEVDLYRAGSEKLRIVEAFLNMGTVNNDTTFNLLSRFEQLPIHRQQDLAVPLREIKELALKKNMTNKQFGILIRALEETILARELINKREEVMSWLNKKIL